MTDGSSMIRMLYVLVKGDAFLNRDHKVEPLEDGGGRHPAEYLVRAAVFESADIGTAEESAPEPDLYLERVVDWEKRLWEHYRGLPSAEREQRLKDWLGRRGQ